MEPNEIEGVKEETVKDLLDKFERNQEEFIKIVEEYKNNSSVGKKYGKEIISFLKKNSVVKFKVPVKKMEECQQDVNVVQMAKRPDIGNVDVNQLNRVNAVKNVTIKFKEIQVDVTVWVDFFSGLYNFKLDFERDFLTSTGIYDFNKIAAFLGMETQVDRNNKKGEFTQVTFIKKFNEFENVTLNDITTIDSKNKKEFKYIKNKKILKLTEVKNNAIMLSNKIVQYIVLIEDVIKQLHKKGGY